jgi:hypothetical protein
MPLAPRPSPLAPRLSPLASRPSPLTPCPSSFAPRPSPRLWINPDFQDLLQRLGLTEAAQFLDLPGLIVSGHPDRHVVRVYLGGPDGLEAYLKREHRVGWRHYLASAWAGFGWTSRSVREAQTLAALRQAGGPVRNGLRPGKTVTVELSCSWLAAPRRLTSASS